MARALSLRKGRSTRTISCTRRFTSTFSSAGSGSTSERSGSRAGWRRRRTAGVVFHESDGHLYGRTAPRRAMWNLSASPLFRTGQGLFDVQVGLAAALFLAVAPLAVRDSHYVKHDVPVTLMIVLPYVAIIRIWPPSAQTATLRKTCSSRPRSAASRFSTHYYCIFLALPLVWAIVQRWREPGWRVVLRHLVTAAIVSAFVFFALSPFLLVEPLTALRDITANRQIVVDRAVAGRAFCSAAALYRDALDRLDGPYRRCFRRRRRRLYGVRAPARAVLLLLFPALVPAVHRQHGAGAAAI